MSPQYIYLKKEQNPDGRERKWSAQVSEWPSLDRFPFAEYKEELPPVSSSGHIFVKWLVENILC